MSNAGLWDQIHSTIKGTRSYGSDDSYALGAEWLADCSLVEDWGCGGGHLKNFIEPERYRGIDGSHTPHADQVADLTEYRSEVPGIFMRHVLDHNWQWQTILENALASFTEAMFLALFVPLSEGETFDTEWEDPPGVPNLSISREELYRALDACDGEWMREDLGNAMPYGLKTPKLVGTETIFRISR